jgi:hypothetical protein
LLDFHFLCWKKQQNWKWQWPRVAAARAKKSKNKTKLCMQGMCAECNQNCALAVTVGDM